MTYKIMVVDDEPANLRLLERLFRHEYQVLTASSGAEALRLLDQHDVALLLTDQRMPGMPGLELLQRTVPLRPHMVRIIISGYTDIGALVEAINCGEVYRYVAKPWNNEELRTTVSRALEHYEMNRARYELEQVNQRLAQRLKEMTRGFVRAIADALEAKDEHIHGHARRVSGYAVATGRRLGLGDEELEALSLAAFLHDIGKIGTPDEILLRPSTLTSEQRAVMQLHPERGARMLAGIPAMEEVAAAVRHHHENFDGTGYPEGLTGEFIPLLSRIVHVADAYDAMTSPRPFRAAALDHETALERLYDAAGRQFDPQIVSAFAELEALAQIRRSLAPETWGAALSVAAFTLNEHRLDFHYLRRQAETEPALAAAVLREANRDATEGPTARLNEACSRLGERRLRALVARMGTPARDTAAARDLWQHSLRAAIAARLLAERTALVDSGDAYTLGLLHDAGEMLLAALFPAARQTMAGLDGEARIEREVAAFGVDHAQVSQWVLEACGLPRALTSAAQTHHDVMRINAPGALLLHVADAIALADDPSEVTALDALGSDRLALLGLRRADLADIHARTTAAMEQQLMLLKEAGAEANETASAETLAGPALSGEWDVIA